MEALDEEDLCPGHACLAANQQTQLNGYLGSTSYLLKFGTWSHGLLNGVSYHVLGLSVWDYDILDLD